MGVVFDDYVQNLPHYKQIVSNKISLRWPQGLPHSMYDILRDEYNKIARSIILEDVTKRLNIDAEQAMIEIEELDLRLLI